MSEKQLHINDLFWTYQGEGAHAGRRALFVRMPFCNLACTWCDTEFNSYRKMVAGDVRQVAMAEPSRFAVITGGEPMLNRHTPRVIDVLKELGFEIACETNGTAPILPGIDYATVSPKRFSQGRRGPLGGSIVEPYFIHPHAFLHASEFKYVVDADLDFEMLERHDTTDGRRYSLSPEWSSREHSLKRIFIFIAENPGWRISLQTHKIMGVK